MELRVYAREIHETFCVQPKCKFFGQRAQQGVCFSSKSHLGGGPDWSHVEKAEKSAVDLLKDIKKGTKNKADYLKRLESYFVSNWMNQCFTLDALVYLRVKVALAEKKK